MEETGRRDGAKVFAFVFWMAEPRGLGFRDALVEPVSVLGGFGAGLSLTRAR